MVGGPKNNEHAAGDKSRSEKSPQELELNSALSLPKIPELDIHVQSTTNRNHFLSLRQKEGELASILYSDPNTLNLVIKLLDQVSAGEVDIRNVFQGRPTREANLANKSNNVVQLVHPSELWRKISESLPELQVTLKELALTSNGPARQTVQADLVHQALLDAKFSTWTLLHLAHQTISANADELTPANKAVIKGLAREIESERGFLAKSNFGLVSRIASSYSRQPSDYDDLFQEGSRGLLKAIDGYNPNHPAPFSGYARFQIKAEIFRFLANSRDSMPRLPENRRAQLTKLARTEDKLRAEGMEATVEELHDRTGFKKSDIELLRTLRFKSHSLNAESPHGGTDLSDRVPDLSASPILDGIISRELPDKVAQALSQLGAREQEIIKLRFFDEFSLREAGQKIGLSYERIRQIENALLKKLRRSPILSELNES